MIKSEIDLYSRSLNFYNQMSERRSIRNFSSRSVDKRILYAAIKTAGTAPSGANRQPWHFALVTSPLVKSEIRVAAEAVESEFYTSKASEQWLNDLKPFGTNSAKPYLTEAPALICVFSRSTTEVAGGNSLRTYYPIESTGIAVGFLLTALHNTGLATLTHTPKPMSFLNQVLNLNKTYKPFMIIVTGYPVYPIQLPNIKRKQLNEILSEY